MESITAIELETHWKPNLRTHNEASLKVSISSQVCKNSIPYAWISIRLGWMKIYSQWNTIIFVTCKYCVNSKLRKNQDCLQQNLYTTVKLVIALRMLLISIINKSMNSISYLSFLLFHLDCKEKVFQIKITSS